MKKGLKIFLVIFLVVIVLGVALVLAYFNNSFPILNELVDKTFFQDKIEVEPEVVEVVYEEPKENLPNLQNLNAIVVSSKEIKKAYISKDLEDYSYPSLNFELSSDCYSLSCQGDFSWECNFEYPIISSLGIFGDSVGFITSEYNFVLVDIKSGKMISKHPLGTTAKAESYENQVAKHCFYPIFDFVTENDEKQSLVFGDSEKYFSITSVEKPKSSLKNQFAPTKEAGDFILSRIKSWGTEKISDTLPSIDFYVDGVDYIFDDDSVKLYVLSNENPGKYTVGLMNENGALISDNAVVAVFSEDGNLIEVSLGYVANEPNVSVYLEDQIYYIVAYRTFLDESSLKEVYLGVKKVL